MENKNFDCIKGSNIQNKNPPQTITKKVAVDAIARRKTNFGSISERSHFVFARAEKPKNFLAFKFLPYFIAVMVLMAFSAGSYLTWRTDKSAAEDSSQNQNFLAARVPLQPAALGATALGPISAVPEEVLFNLTLDQLENYLVESLTTPEMKEAEKLADRKFKLKIYLDEKASPLIGIADALAELKHWKMILAISNSESTLGKRCYNNNCSGIGVEPGHPYWRNYNSKAEWARDLDKLIEKKYKNWTLEQMNGVYNQPGSKNWLLAAKQILEELEERGIE